MMRYVLIALSCCLLGFAGIVSAGAPNGFGDGSVGEELKIPGTDQVQENEKFLDVVRGAINRVLGILGLVALIVIMIGGFIILTAGGSDQKYDLGWTYLKTAIMGLILIGIAWFIVSLVFWLVNVIADPAGPAQTDQ